MARPRLTKEAIAFIIERRDDPTTIYTLQDIADMIDERLVLKYHFRQLLAIIINTKMIKAFINPKNQPKQKSKKDLFLNLKKQLLLYLNHYLKEMKKWT
ncbi:hypothetical protein I6G26_00465 (plasmid) [Moraxella nonliquefaciens]|uniref:HTH HARE-type domain-containing protein n=1 Tax=Moraxella nonliquefaciens TaxID=478 RepID=A0A7T3BXF8_MORNO|nr:hypothetical protein [Moraxella nonliquefaciens]QPT43597.1 hypothetical protein I6G26_00465 [Moraxella nonliquefaciens]